MDDDNAFKALLCAIPFGLIFWGLIIYWMFSN